MSEKFEWSQLLSEKRHNNEEQRKEKKQKGERTEFESDYDRVVFSEPFRRLAKKTQVHPLAPNDHIHNRLIHSIEVGSVGRSLGKNLQSFLHKNGSISKDYHELPTVVQVGCLVHDIGNPPFGHAGESAIRDWICEHQDIVFNSKYPLSDEIKRDLLMFEGNAQGFRLASRKDNSSGYLRLTYASLGAMIKYPWSSDDKRANEKKKYNLFSSEKKIFDELAAEMGLTIADGSVARHPLSFLTEAADDICYSILDMEDAVSMRILSEKPILDLFLKIAGRQPRKRISISEARARAIGKLIDEAWLVFENDYENIMIGARQKDLKAGFPKLILESFESIDKYYREIFLHRSKLAYEVGSYKVLGRIIKSLVLSAQALSEHGNYDDLKFISKKCFELAWDEHYAEDNKDKSYEWWLMQIFDFVSGLTDNYAIQISNEIEGTLLS